MVPDLPLFDNLIDGGLFLLLYFVFVYLEVLNL